MEYLVIIERANDGSYSAYVPDLPGCVSSGDTQDEAKTMIKEAMEAHIDLLRTRGEPVPPPTSTAFSVIAA